MGIAEPIQQIPIGLLGFFQLKNRGQNPFQMPESLTPVLEMRDWYFQTARESLVAPSAVLVPTNSTAFIGLGAIGTVPQGEQWVLTDVFATTTLIAAEVIGYQLASLLQPTVTGNPQTQVYDNVVVTGSGANVAVRAGFHGYIWLPPGAEIGIAVKNATTAGNITVTMNVYGVRIPI